MCRYQRNIPLLYILQRTCSFWQSGIIVARLFLSLFLSLFFHFGFYLISLSHNSTWTVRCFYFIFSSSSIFCHTDIYLFSYESEWIFALAWWQIRNICSACHLRGPFLYSFWSFTEEEKKNHTHSSSRIACITSMHNK